MTSSRNVGHPPRLDDHRNDRQQLETHGNAQQDDQVRSEGMDGIQSLPTQAVAVLEAIGDEELHAGTQAFQVVRQQL